jgi:hypothetical protein
LGAIAKVSDARLEEDRTAGLWIGFFMRRCGKRSVPSIAGSPSLWIRPLIDVGSSPSKSPNVSQSQLSTPKGTAGAGDAKFLRHYSEEGNCWPPLLVAWPLAADEHVSLWTSTSNANHQRPGLSHRTQPLDHEIASM